MKNIVISIVWNLFYTDSVVYRKSRVDTNDGKWNDTGADYDGVNGNTLVIYMTEL